MSVKAERLGPDDQVVCEHHDLHPHLVHRELFERQLAKAGVFVVADAVLDPGALAVAAFDNSDVLVGLVGQDRLEAVSVMVGERQLRAGVRPLNEPDAKWAWADLPVEPTKPEWTWSAIPVDPTPPGAAASPAQWIWGKVLPVEDTPDTWTWIDVPFEVSG